MFIKLEFKNTLTYSINSFGVLPVLYPAHDCIAYSGIVGSKRKPKSLCFLVDGMTALIMHHTNYEYFVKTLVYVSVISKRSSFFLFFPMLPIKFLVLFNFPQCYA